MAKNIVVFSDGTGQDGGHGPNTNVYKLFNVVLDRSPEQIAFYDRGLGTGWRKLTGKATGVGISRNIRECYEFIFDNFEAGDKIYLFGFSRGAATVRSLSGFIHLFGMLPKSRPELIRQAYKIYKIRDAAEREAKARDFVERHHTMWTRIEFLGAWDTVAALGIPLSFVNDLIDKIPMLNHKFHDFRLSECVGNAYHALAIDDERKTFHPTLWDPELRERQTMRQVWFCGMHTDVGGGYPEPGLSDIALDWMLGKAKKHGLKIYARHTIKIDGNADGFMHDSRGSFFKRLYRRKARSWPVETHGKPVVHESVPNRKRNRHNEAEPPYAPWILADPEGYETESPD